MKDIQSKKTPIRPLNHGAAERGSKNFDAFCDLQSFFKSRAILEHDILGLDNRLFLFCGMGGSSTRRACVFICLGLMNKSKNFFIFPSEDQRYPPLERMWLAVLFLL